MKLILGVIVILLGVASADESGGLPTREEQEELYLKCMLSSERKTDLTSNKCHLQSVGIIKEDGTIDVGAFEKILKYTSRNGEEKELAQICNVQQKNPEETAEWVRKCIMENESSDAML